MKCIFIILLFCGYASAEAPNISFEVDMGAGITHVHDITNNEFRQEILLSIDDPPQTLGDDGYIIDWSDYPSPVETPE